MDRSRKQRHPPLLHLAFTSSATGDTGMVGLHTVQWPVTIQCTIPIIAQGHPWFGWPRIHGLCILRALVICSNIIEGLICDERMCILQYFWPVTIHCTIPIIAQGHPWFGWPPNIHGLCILRALVMCSNIFEGLM